MNSLIAVALGGAMGSLARYALGLWTRGHALTFPLATLMVNVLGGLLMGLVAGYTAARPEFPAWLRAGLMTGVLGGFTTFSAFSLETLALYRDGAASMALFNVAANVLLSLAACALGFALISR